MTVEEVCKTESLYETFRSRFNVPKSNTDYLISLFDKEHFKDFFKDLQNKEIILVERYIDTNIVDEFKIGHFKELGFYKNGGYYPHNKRDFDGHIWLNEINYATGLSQLYDIMKVDSINKELIKNPEISDLKIFSFFDDGESIKVIHTDPFLAYISARKNEKIKGEKHSLGNMEKFRIGVSFHERDFNGIESLDEES